MYYILTTYNSYNKSDSGLVLGNYSKIFKCYYYGSLNSIVQFQMVVGSRFSSFLSSKGFQEIRIWSTKVSMTQSCIISSTFNNPFRWAFLLGPMSSRLFCNQMIFLKFTFLHTSPFIWFKLRALIYLQDQLREKFITPPVLSMFSLIYVFLSRYCRKCFFFTFFWYIYILTMML